MRTKCYSYQIINIVYKIKLISAHYTETIETNNSYGNKLLHGQTPVLGEVSCDHTNSVFDLLY